MEKGVYQAHFQPSTARSIQERLIAILDWFGEWEKVVSEHKTHGKNQFLADQTWTGLKCMIIGYIGLIGHFVETKKFTIVPQRTTSDPCENHFCNTRGSFGAGRSGSGAMCDMADTAAANLLSLQRSSSSLGTVAPAEPNPKVMLLSYRNSKKDTKGRIQSAHLPMHVVVLVAAATPQSRLELEMIQGASRNLLEHYVDNIIAICSAYIQSHRP